MECKCIRSHTSIMTDSTELTNSTELIKPTQLWLVAEKWELGTKVLGVCDSLSKAKKLANEYYSQEKFKIFNFRPSNWRPFRWPGKLIADVGEDVDEYVEISEITLNTLISVEEDFSSDEDSL